METIKYKVVKTMKYTDVFGFILIFIIGIAAVFCATVQLMSMRYEGLVADAYNMVDQANAVANKATKDRNDYELKYIASVALANRSKDLNARLIESESQNYIIEDQLLAITQEINDLKIENSFLADQNDRMSKTKNYITGYDMVVTAKGSQTIDDEAFYNIKLALDKVNGRVIKAGEAFNLWPALTYDGIYHYFLDPASTGVDYIETQPDEIEEPEEPENIEPVKEFIKIKGFELVATGIYNEARRLEFEVSEATSNGERITAFDSEHHLVIVNNSDVDIKISTIISSNSFDIKFIKMG